MISKVEIIFVVVEKNIFLTQHYILILSKNTMECLQKELEHGLIQNQKEVDLKRMIFYIQLKEQTMPITQMQQVKMNNNIIYKKFMPKLNRILINTRLKAQNLLKVISKQNQISLIALAIHLLLNCFQNFKQV